LERVNVQTRQWYRDTARAPKGKKKSRDPVFGTVGGQGKERTIYGYGREKSLKTGKVIRRGCP